MDYDTMSTEELEVALEERLNTMMAPEDKKGLAEYIQMAIDDGKSGEDIAQMLRDEGYVVEPEAEPGPAEEPTEDEEPEDKGDYAGMSKDDAYSKTAERLMGGGKNA